MPSPGKGCLAVAKVDTNRVHRCSRARPPCRRLDRFARLVKQLGGLVDQHEGGAGGGELCRDQLADAARTAREHDDLALHRLPEEARREERGDVPAAVVRQPDSEVEQEACHGLGRGGDAEEEDDGAERGVEQHMTVCGCDGIAVRGEV